MGTLNRAFQRFENWLSIPLNLMKPVTHVHADPVISWPRIRQNDDSNHRCHKAKVKAKNRIRRKISYASKRYNRIHS